MNLKLFWKIFTVVAFFVAIGNFWFNEPFSSKILFLAICIINLFYVFKWEK